MTGDRSKAGPYLDRLKKEIILQSRLFDAARPVDQIHFGGGTPTFINMSELRELMKVLAENFRLHDDGSGEYSIELDPRDIEVEELAQLKDMGFNRLSFGIQDFNE
ncbi:MAG: radical SAM protein, partial [Thiohalomonadales bacterium]